jgi:hypothetical protein
LLYSKRVRKKKQLTDPVEIIPFTNQLNKNTPKPHVTPAATQNKEYLQQKIEAKILSVPTGNLNTTNPTIKKILQQKEESPVQSSMNQKNLPYETFSFDQVKMAWRRYAHDAKAKGMETFYNAMIKRDPKQIETTQFIMDVDNQIQVDYITPHLQDLVGYLRAELKNYEVNLELKLSENNDVEVKFLTGKDRFADMAKKNPNLHSFKNIFNLDIEF